MLVVVLVLAVVGAVLAWRWYDDPDQRAERLRDDLADLPGVSEVAEGGPEPEVRLESDVTTAEATRVLEEVHRYQEAVTADGGMSAIGVRSGWATTSSSAWMAPVDASLLLAVGTWEPPGGTTLEVERYGDGQAVSMTTDIDPAVVTAQWLVDRAATLDVDLRSLLETLQVTGSDDGSETAWVVGAAVDQPSSVRALMGIFATFAEHHPTVVVVRDTRGGIEVEVDRSEVARTRAQLRRALRGYEGLVLTERPGAAGGVRISADFTDRRRNA